MRLLLVEDELDLGTAIKRILSQENYLVDWALDGQEALFYLENPDIQYDLAVVDWMLPELSGLDLCKYLRKKGLSLPILMLTAKERLQDKVEGLDAGVDDYLVKPFCLDELLARLRALARRSPFYQPQKLQVGSLILDCGSRNISCENYSPVLLNKKEFQLLEYLMRHPNQILTSDQIRYQLWEFDSESFSNVVAAQMRLLRKKLALLKAENLIETVYGVGYRFNINHAPK
jgi:DNA-binding response OmpR family regulator